MIPDLKPPKKKKKISFEATKFKVFIVQLRCIYDNCTGAVIPLNWPPDQFGCFKAEKGAIIKYFIHTAELWCWLCFKYYSCFHSSWIHFFYICCLLPEAALIYLSLDTNKHLLLLVYSERLPNFLEWISTTADIQRKQSRSRNTSPQKPATAIWTLLWKIKGDSQLSANNYFADLVILTGIKINT